MDVGTRDGYIAVLLAERYDLVAAIDLVKPSVIPPNVLCVRGDVTALPYPDGFFDLVLCSEVLEHIPEPHLTRACQELVRVSASHVLIGVPYKQDLRCARTLCRSCGHRNPPWSHVNSFDEDQLGALFPSLQRERVSFVGQTREATNAVSTLLMDLAGNPFGTYAQEEPCTSCGMQLGLPRERSLPQRVLTKIAVHLDAMQERLTRPRPKWIHLLLRK